MRCFVARASDQIHQRRNPKYTRSHVITHDGTTSQLPSRYPQARAHLLTGAPHSQAPPRAGAWRARVAGSTNQSGHRGPLCLKCLSKGPLSGARGRGDQPKGEDRGSAVAASKHLFSRLLACGRRFFARHLTIKTLPKLGNNFGETNNGPKPCRRPSLAIQRHRSHAGELGPG